MTLVQIAKDGPTGSIRKMREIESTFFPWKMKRILGYVWLQDLLELEKEMSIEKETNVPSVYTSYSVEDMLP
jgi:glycine betaine/proline transport system ATP-binding protein